MVMNNPLSLGLGLFIAIIPSALGLIIIFPTSLSKFLLIMGSIANEFILLKAKLCSKRKAGPPIFKWPSVLDNYQINQEIRADDLSQCQKSETLHEIQYEARFSTYGSCYNERGIHLSSLFLSCKCTKTQQSWTFAPIVNGLCLIMGQLIANGWWFNNCLQWEVHTLDLTTTCCYH